MANTGKVAGEHVVQLYIRDRVASRTRPVRELKRFLRVAPEAGREREVRFGLERGSLMFVGDNDRWIAEPGMFDLGVANSAGGRPGGEVRVVGGVGWRDRDEVIPKVLGGVLFALVFLLGSFLVGGRYEVRPAGMPDGAG